MKLISITAALSALLATSACLPGDDGLSDGQGAATPISCDITDDSTMNLNAADPVFVDDGQLFVIRIDTQDQNGLLFKVPDAQFALLDASVEVTSARLGEDDQGRPTTVGGFPAYNTDPGTFYQYYKADWGVLSAIEVPAGASYKFYSSRATNGAIGTCGADNLE